MIQTNYNPDVLSCLAKLSNDEVFTPPGLANDILDLLPASIWRNQNATFLDPVCKSGVFLREIAKRLDKGLETQIPDRQKRINHIFTKQLFGIAITELTSLLSRRSVYCSKTANGKYSVCETFDNDQGNIYFKKVNHTWVDGKCTHCGANQEVYDREDGLETYASNFIHTDKPEKLFNMKFDVIVGNPPYQLSDGGGMGTSATPIYQKFVEQAKKLKPRYLSMIIPSRWFSGGRGLDEFRIEMLKDSRISKIVDYFDSNECFPGVDISGGVCYFLWEKEYNGQCEVKSVRSGIISVLKRNLLEKDTDTFIRFNEAIPILRKVQKFEEKSFSSSISANDPFGFDVRVENSYKRVAPKFAMKKFDGSCEFYYNGWQSKGIGYIEKSKVQKNKEWLTGYKILVSKAYGERGAFPYRVIAKPFLIGQNSCCTETYLVIGPFANKKKAENVVNYMNTKFFRFLVLLIKNTQNAMKKVYSFVPMQDFNESWTDEKLYKKYGLTKNEIAFIESMIRPMDLTQTDEADE
jgi:site-specific DNA-methyltransferase (adenine-specific)